MGEIIVLSIISAIAAIVLALGVKGYFDKRKTAYDDITIISIDLKIVFPFYLTVFPLLAVFGEQIVGLIGEQIASRLALVIVIAPLFLSFSLPALLRTHRCKTKVTATYVDYFGEKGSGFGQSNLLTYYRPVFEYEIDGVGYRAKAYDTFTWKELDSTFIKGEVYDIFVWDKYPTLCRTTDKTATKENAISILLLIIAFMAICTL